jgi:hypothetical protein
MFWDTFLDVVSTAYSAWKVIKEPKNPSNWAALAADVACLAVPFATGGGTIVRGAAKYGDDVLSAGIRAGGNATDSGKKLNRIENTGSAAISVGKTLSDANVSVHGNSLNSSKVNYGYVLLNKDNEIMKFGETINPNRRYTKKFLNEKGYTMNVLTSGTKLDIHYWQYDMNMYYKEKYNIFPPENKRGW